MLLFHGESYLSIVTSFDAPSVLCACVAARLHPVFGVATRERSRTDTFPEEPLVLLTCIRMAWSLVITLQKALSPRIDAQMQILA